MRLYDETLAERWRKRKQREHEEHEERKRRRRSHCDSAPDETTPSPSIIPSTDPPTTTYDSPSLPDPSPSIDPGGGSSGGGGADSSW
jgi:hypothetical protein